MLLLLLLGGIALAQAIPPIATHLSDAWSVCRLAVHTYAITISIAARKRAPPTRCVL